MMCAMGIAGEVAATENNSSLAPLIPMAIPDMPNVPPQNVPVIIAQANQAQPGDVSTLRAIGVCHPAPNGDYNSQNMVDPIGEAGFYLRSYEHQKVQNIGTVSVLKQPAHGVLRLMTEADGNTFGEGRFVAADQLYVYLPEAGYLGKDSASFVVEIAGVKVKVVYYFEALGPGANLGNYGLEELCGETGYHWKISATLDANGNSAITSVN